LLVCGQFFLGDGLLVEEGDFGERAYVASGSPGDPEVRAVVRSERPNCRRGIWRTW
jgi:hypothetical protein